MHPTQENHAPIVSEAEPLDLNETHAELLSATAKSLGISESEALDAALFSGWNRGQ